MNTATKVAAAWIDATKPEENYCMMNVPVLLEQIGRINVLSISGGRICHTETGVLFPVAQGYWVTVHLSSDDTYVVRRVFYRSKHGKVKSEWRNVYAEQVGEIAYRASLYCE